MNQLNSEPRRLEPDSYEYRLLNDVYGTPWEYPLPKDFDKAFSYILNNVLSEREQRLLNELFGQCMPIKEIRKIERSWASVNSAIRGSLHKLRIIDATPILINGLDYYNDPKIPIRDMPLMIVMNMDGNSLSFRTTKILSRYKIYTVGDLHEEGLYNLEMFKRIGKLSMNEIESVLDYYNLDKGIFSLGEYLPRSTRNSLIRTGITSIKMLRNMSEEELLSIRGIGVKSISDIKNLLEHYDFENNRISD